MNRTSGRILIILFGSLLVVCGCRQPAGDPSLTAAPAQALCKPAARAENNPNTTAVRGHAGDDSALGGRQHRDPPGDQGGAVAVAADAQPIDGPSSTHDRAERAATSAQGGMAKPDATPPPGKTQDTTPHSAPNTAPNSTDLVPRRFPAVDDPPSADPLNGYQDADGMLEELPSPEGVAAVDPLPLRDVVRSVHMNYPLLRAAIEERRIAGGKALAAWGEFDLQLKGSSIAGPEGFYQTYRHGVGLTQPTFQGGYLYGGYRLGRGFFQDWYKERQTNEGGEFSAGLGMPLLKGRDIDERRSELFQAQLARQAVEPAVQAELLQYVRDASQLYWVWVASGRVLQAQQELLRLAQQRVRQIDERVAAGDLEQIARINNQQLIASRETTVIEAYRKLQMTAIKLSLFLRRQDGQPVVPPPSRLPDQFPQRLPLDEQALDRGVREALAARPELVELQLQMEKTRVELAEAENSLLPKLDAVVLASQDVGAPATSKRDKSPFELEAGIYGEVPLQRRAAQGKIEAARGKLSQLQAKREFVANKVVAEVQDAVSALRAAEARITRSRSNLELAEQTLALGREQFEAGDIDVQLLNLYEQAATDAQFKLISAEADYFIAVADYKAALARNPLDVGDIEQP